LIASYADGPFTALRTDGFGLSETRVALRAFFDVDRHHIVIAALSALAFRGDVAKAGVAEAIAGYGVEASGEPPWTR